MIRESTREPFCALIAVRYLNGATASIITEERVEKKEDGIDKRVACLTLEGSTDVMLGGRPVRKDGETLGYVQVGDYGYTVSESIAYTYLPSEYAEAGTSVRIECEGATYDATVRDEPLFDPGRDKIIR